MVSCCLAWLLRPRETDDRWALRTDDDGGGVVVVHNDDEPFLVSSSCGDGAAAVG
jgi:hypothetical protein